MSLQEVIDALESEDLDMGGGGNSTYGEAALMLRTAKIALEFYATKENYYEACIPLQNDYGKRARAWLTLGNPLGKPGTVIVGKSARRSSRARTRKR